MLHTALLDELIKGIQQRKEDLRLSMARGLEGNAYWKAVGAHAECERLIDQIREVAVVGEASIDDDDSETTGR